MDNQGMAAVDRGLQAVEGHPYYDPADTHGAEELDHGSFQVQLFANTVGA